MTFHPSLSWVLSHLGLLFLDSSDSGFTMSQHLTALPLVSFVFSVPSGTLMLSLLNHSNRPPALTAVSVLHYATIPQESGIFLMQTTSQDFHPSLPGECPDNVLLSAWLLLHPLSC